MKDTMAIDQYGHAYHGLGNHPRKALLERLDRKRASKMYVDTKTGTKHIGYIIRGLWLTVYNVTRWEGNK
jgi:hypothetical protein